MKNNQEEDHSQEELSKTPTQDEMRAKLTAFINLKAKAQGRTPQEVLTEMVQQTRENKAAESSK